MTQMVNRKKKLKICRQYFPVVRIKEKIDSSYIEQQILRGETKGYYTYEEANFVLQNFISQRFMCADDYDSGVFTAIENDQLIGEWVQCSETDKDILIYKIVNKTVVL